MIKLIHTADLHLDFPFASLDAKERDLRREEQRNALIELCDVCRGERIDVLLIAGDLFDSDFIRSSTPGFVAECFSSIPDTHIFISPGNHDPYSAHSPYRSARFTDNVHIFESERLSRVELPNLNTTVYGFGFTSSCVRSSPLDVPITADDSMINLLVAHGDLDTSSEYCEIKSTALSAFDYVALGHIHKPSGFMKFGRTVCAYSGCLVPCGFDECGDRGYIIGELSKGNVALRYNMSSQRRYEIADVDISGITDEENILDMIEEKCRDMDKKCSVRINLCGSVPCAPRISEERVRLRLSHTCFTELCDNTVVMPDISELIKENSLRGEFCRKLDPLTRSENERERKVAALALEYGLDALDG